jgi:hypothetical protein
VTASPALLNHRPTDNLDLAFAMASRHRREIFCGRTINPFCRAWLSRDPAGLSFAASRQPKSRNPCSQHPVHPRRRSRPCPAWLPQRRRFRDRRHTMAGIADISGQNAIHNVNDCRGFLNRSQTNYDRRFNSRPSPFRSRQPSDRRRPAGRCRRRSCFGSRRGTKLRKRSPRDEPSAPEASSQ